MDRFDSLPNIKENIETKLKKKPLIKSEKEALAKIDDLYLCQDAINKSIDTLTSNNNNLSEQMKDKEKELSKNMEIFLQKLEEDTNRHIKIIENSNLSGLEKKNEMIKCLEELDKISLLSEALENCIEISEVNFLKFLEKPLLFNRDNLIEFLVKEEESLKQNNIYNQLVNYNQHCENLYNETQISYLKNFISQSSLLTEDNVKLNKLKINENSDIGNVKELLISINQKNEVKQNKIKKIILHNIPKDYLKYLFSKSENLLRTNSLLTQSTKSVAIMKDTDLKKAKTNESLNPDSSKEMKDNSISVKYDFPNITFKNCDCSEFNFRETFPKLNKLKLVSCKLPFLFFDLDKDLNSFGNITELYLENCDIVDENFKEIYYVLLQNQHLSKKLKALSFKKNKISIISVYNYFDTGDRAKYKLFGLEFLDFSYNSIMYYNINLFESLPKIQVIDFSNNNIQLKDKIDEFYKVIKTRKKKADNYANEVKAALSQSNISETSNLQKEQSAEVTNDSSKAIQVELLFEIGGNIAFNREPDLEKYCKFLLNTIPFIDFPLRSLNLSGIFYQKTLHKHLFKLDLSNFKNSLVELDLSLCNLTDYEFSKLFVNQFLLRNLKKLNLSYNKFTDNFFKLLIENDSHELFDNLKEIDLSNNEIYLNNDKEIKKFVQLFDCIQKIILNDTPIEENINNYIQKKIIRFNEEQNDKEIKTEFNKEELSIKDLFENKDEKFGNQSKIKLIMDNKIDYGFISACKKLYPELFENLEVKYKYNYV